MKVFITFSVCISIIFYAVISFSQSDEICCTWFNLKHIKGNFPQKIMFHYDGTFATYNKFESINAITRGTFQIIKKWSDPNGNIWYQIIMNDHRKEKKFKLASISQNGRALEFVCNSEKFPQKIDTQENSYCNFLRASMDYTSPP